MAKTKRYPGHIVQRGDTFRVRFYVDGERFNFTVATTDRRVAERFAVNKYQSLGEYQARRQDGLPDSIRVSALLDQFEREVIPGLAEGTQRSYADSLRPIRIFFLGALNDPKVEEIRARHIAAYLTWRRTFRLLGGIRKGERQNGEKFRAALAAAAMTPATSGSGPQLTPAQPPTKLTGAARRAAYKRAYRAARRAIKPISGSTTVVLPTPVSNRTLAKDRTVLHTIFALADRLEYRDGNPVARTKAPKVDERDPVLLTNTQYETLLAQCTDPILKLYTLALNESGARCESEVLFLKPEDIDLEDGFLWIANGRGGHRTKNGKGRWVPMTERLQEALRVHLATTTAANNGAPQEWIFQHPRDITRREAGRRIESLRSQFKRAAERAGLPIALHQHDFRHRRITTWLAEGKNPVHVKEAVGHADLRTTMKYTHLARKHLRSLVDSPTTASPPPESAATVVQ